MQESTKICKNKNGELRKEEVYLVTGRWREERYLPNLSPWSVFHLMTVRRKATGGNRVIQRREMK